MSKLFDGNDSDCGEDLKINDGYATNYNNWRQKEELNKLKTKYGEHIKDLASSNEDSESSSEDDEEGTEITEEFEKDFYKTLACLKKKDPKIYDENVKFFSQDDKTPVNKKNRDESTKKSKKDKSLYLRDYERKIVTERDGKFSESEDEEEFRKKNNVSNSLTYVEEQRRIKESIKEVLKADESSNNSEDDLLLPKKKTTEEKHKEEEVYKEWLRGQKTDLETPDKEELKPLKDFWTDPNLDENEAFLRDYILNKKFLEKDTGDYKNYEERVHDSDDNLSEDERNIEKQEEFEHKYNFRFEEPDQDFIKRFPRTVENSLRKKDTRRAEKRAEVKKRKEEEKLKKQEELKQLKALKRKEIADKIAQLKEITGNDDMQFDSIDLDGDFDPDEHDRKMRELFDDDYYDNNADESVKPEFPDIDEELEIESTWDNYDPNEEAAVEKGSGSGLHCEDDGFIMDADYDANKALQDELTKSSRKKRKRRSKFAEMISKEKPKFDPTVHTSYKNYIDQYYALDYEDMIGDLPCRFKYRNVVPNDYGLSIEEILMADDKELNKWCSLKKALEHKSEHQELNEVKMYKQKSQNELHKKKILQSLYKPLEENNAADVNGENEEDSGDKKRRKRNRKKKSQSTADNGTSGVALDGKVENIQDAESSKKPAINKKRKADKEESEKEPEDKKLKLDNTRGNNEANAANEGKKKKKKKKVGNSSLQSVNTNEKTIDSKTKQEKRKEKYKKLQKSKDLNKDPISSMSDDRLKAYGINPKSFKNKLKYGKQR